MCSECDKGLALSARPEARACCAPTRATGTAPVVKMPKTQSACGKDDKIRSQRVIKIDDGFRMW